MAGAGEFAQLLRDVAWLLERLATQHERATPPQRYVGRKGATASIAEQAGAVHRDLDRAT